jgi:cytochrome b6-f complex iron-sulfur subunit
VERRDVLGLAGLWASGLAVFGSILGMMRLPRPRVLPEPSGKLKIGRPEDLPAGTVRLLAGKGVRLEATEAGIAALSLICTHLGCVVREEGGQFLCPCHGSRFGPGGELLQGPAPRPLRWLEVSQGPDGSLLVDVTREVPAGTFWKT